MHKLGRNPYESASCPEAAGHVPTTFHFTLPQVSKIYLRVPNSTRLHFPDHARRCVNKARWTLKLKRKPVAQVSKSDRRPWRCARVKPQRGTVRGGVEWSRPDRTPKCQLLVPFSMTCFTNDLPDPHPLTPTCSDPESLVLSEGSLF